MTFLLKPRCHHFLTGKSGANQYSQLESVQEESSSTCLSLSRSHLRTLKIEPGPSIFNLKWFQVFVITLAAELRFKCAHVPVLNEMI